MSFLLSFFCHFLSFSGVVSFLLSFFVVIFVIFLSCFGHVRGWCLCCCHVSAIFLGGADCSLFFILLNRCCLAAIAEALACAGLDWGSWFFRHCPVIRNHLAVQVALRRPGSQLGAGKGRGQEGWVPESQARMGAGMGARRAGMPVRSSRRKSNNFQEHCHVFAICLFFFLSSFIVCFCFSSPTRHRLTYKLRQ